MTRLLPWMGWIGGLAGWLLSQQLGTSVVQLDCDSAIPIPVLLFIFAGALAAVGGGYASWRVWRRSEDTRRFIAFTAALAAAVFLGAIVLQALALVIPQCDA
jgi:hypothetical protein